MFSDEFGRLITAIVTPFKEDLSVDLDSLEKIIDSIIEQKTTSILVNGTTGESPNLNLREKLKLLSFIKQVSGKQAKVIFGVCLNSTSQTIELAKEASKNKADAILVISPYYNKPNQEGLYLHFSEIAKEINLPIMLYDIPGRTGVRISTEVLQKLLKKHKNIQAIKESPGDLFDKTVQEIPFLSEIYNFQAYSGDDALTLPLLSLGYVGAVSVASHLVGKQIFEMIELFLEKKEPSKALYIHRELLELNQLLFQSPSPGPIKYALNLEGLCENYLTKLPITEPKEELKKSLRNCLLKLKVKFKETKGLIQA